MQTMPTNSSTGLTLAELNAEEARYYLGGAILVSILSATGIVGNIHVLLVYSFRMKQSNHRIFIVCLGVLDLITCTVGMPFVIINFRRPFTFHNSIICKILSFYNYFICLSSACILIVIAVDRYRKICKPYARQMSQKVAKGMCLLAMGLALLLSWPALIMYESTPVATRDPHITGEECNIKIEMKETWYPIIFTGVLLVVACSCFIVLAVLYSVIGRVIWNHRTFRSRSDDTSTEVTSVKSVTDHGFNSAVFHSGSSTDDSNDKSGATETTIDNGHLENGHHQSPDNVSPRRGSVKEQIEMRRKSSSDAPEKPQAINTLQKAIKKFDRAQRTTLMLFWITIVFFLSYVPYLVLRIAYFIHPDWYPSMSFTAKVTFNTILWCVYVNNMANCFIYGFCDQRFRQEVVQVYRRLCRR